MKPKSEARPKRPRRARRPTVVALLRTGILLLGLTIWNESPRADEPDAARAPSIADMDLEGLVKVRIRIASIDAKPVEAQPAVVAMITAKEIERSGAKDLTSSTRRK